MSARLTSFAVLVVSSAVGALAQIPLNDKPSRAVGQARLQLTSTNPNLVEGRELYSPQSVALDTSVSPPVLYVADTLNNRVLAWRNATGFSNGVPADLVIGQRDMYSTLAQGPGTSLSVGLNFPTAVAARGGALYVADTGNNRILRYPTPFAQTDVLPDMVIGQPNFSSRNPNYSGQVNERGLFLSGNNQAFRASLAFDAAGNLYVTDTGNRRVLQYLASDLANGGSALQAKLELGQLDFTSVANPLPLQAQSQQNRTQFASPVGVAFDPDGNLFVADRDLSRVLVFQPPFFNGMAAGRIMGVVLPVQQGQPPVVQSTADRITFIAPLGVVALPGTSGVAVLDSGSHRLLIFDRYRTWPPEDATNPTGFSPSARLVVGHNGGSDYSNRQVNNGQPASSALAFNQPSGAAMAGNEMYLADAGNHRVIVLPFDGTTLQAANRVAGQDRMDTSSPNLIEGREFFFLNQLTRVGDAGLLVDNTSDTPHLYVSDPFNNRVLGFRDLRNLQPGGKADIVIGQPDFTTAMCNYPNNDPNRPTQSSLCHPVGMALDSDGNLYVADSGNGRILRFPAPFSRGGSLPQADLVLGQSNFTILITDPSARTMASPYGLAFAGDSGLLATDQVHNRVLFFPKVNGGFTNGQSATKVFGQPDFFSIGTGGDDNRMKQPQHIAVDTDGRPYVADSGNNRVLIFASLNDMPGADAHAVTILGNLGAPSGIYVSPITGEIWVTNTNSGQALRYARFFDLATNSQPTLAIQEQAVTLALAQDQYGDLFVADGSNRVVIHYPGLASLNGATLLTNRPALAPGMVGALQPVGQQFGTETASYTDLPNPLPLPRVLADIQVLVAGTPAPLYSVSPGLIKFQVPMGAPSSGTLDVSVVRQSTGQILGTSAVPMNVASPGIFLQTDTGSLRQAAVLNEDGTQNSPTNPAARGSVISIFATGQGFVPNAPDDGTAPGGQVPTPEKPRVLIDTCFTDDCGEPDDGIQYSGLAPQQVGVWEIDVRVPLRTVPGNQRFIALYYKSIQSQDPSQWRAVFAVKDK